MYHKVDIITPSKWWVSVDRFRGQLDQLSGTHEFVYLDDYQPGSKQQIVITFDDAFENTWYHAVPILREYGVPFEIFVIGDMLGKWNHFDTAEMSARFCQLHHLQDIAAKGGRIQWHSRSHRALPTLDDEQLEIELSVNEHLKAQFPAPNFRWFAYPYGAHDQRCVDAVSRRFRGALSVDKGSGNDIYQLNRVTVDESWMPPSA
jgi:peptidoglycan/xylan/chitin deacetylase (PgdA/CDA1 family)